MTLTVKAAQLLGDQYQLDAIDRDVLLCHVLGKNRSFLFAFAEAELTADQQRQLHELYRSRQAGEPVAYLTGQREFWSLTLLTSKDTLIPRPDTEVLVETVLQCRDHEAYDCLDLGTGTGAIALAIKSERPKWRVAGVDRIEAAVTLAQKNAKRLSLDVDFACASWCDQIADHSLDVLVSNPPYIDAEDEHLTQGDVRFEPTSALVADEHGLADIRHITSEGVRVLRAGGGLFFEHGWQQAEAVRNNLSDAGYLNITTVQDYGGNDRVTFGFRPESP